MAGQWVIEDDAPKGQWVIEDAPLPSKAAPLTRTDKFMQGARDPFDGAAQLLTNLLPSGLVNAGNRFNNFLADKTGLLGRIPEGGVNQMVRDTEAQYQTQRTAAGETGIDGYRMLGNVLSPANVAIAAKLPQAATIAGRIGVGALGGGASAALNPVAGEDFFSEKAQQVATGAAFGGALPALTGGIARVISPNASTNPQLALLRAEGVKPTVGQMLGGFANRTEERLQSVPLFGDAIAAARQSSSVDLNRAVANRALFSLNKRLPDELTGNDAVLFVRKTLGEAYDNVVPLLSVQKDQPYKTAVTQLETSVKSAAIDPNTRKAFGRFMADEVNPLFQGQQAMTGETFKRLQGKITEKIQQTGAATNADERVLNGAYKELGDQLKQLSIRTNPQAAQELKAIDKGYAQFKIMQRAASSVAADEGTFTPAMLQNAVKAADRSKDKARFSEGLALMQDLSSPGKSLLSNRVPDSGTAGRVALGGGALASGMLNPAIPLSLLAGAGMYTPPAQALLRGLVGSRPGFAEPASDMLRYAAPAFIPGGAQVGLGLLQ